MVFLPLVSSSSALVLCGVAGVAGVAGSRVGRGQGSGLGQRIWRMDRGGRYAIKSHQRSITCHWTSFLEQKQTASWVRLFKKQSIT